MGNAADRLLPHAEFATYAMLTAHFRYAPTLLFSGP
jgi:hypothetical protein